MNAHSAHYQLAPLLAITDRHQSTIGNHQLVAISLTVGHCAAVVGSRQSTSAISFSAGNAIKELRLITLICKHVWAIKRIEFDEIGFWSMKMIKVHCCRFDGTAAIVEHPGVLRGYRMSRLFRMSNLRCFQ